MKNIAIIIIAFLAQFSHLFGCSSTSISFSSDYVPQNKFFSATLLNEIKSNKFKLYIFKKYNIDKHIINNNLIGIIYTQSESEFVRGGTFQISIDTKNVKTSDVLTSKYFDIICGFCDLRAKGMEFNVALSKLKD